MIISPFLSVISPSISLSISISFFLFLSVSLPLALASLSSLSFSIFLHLPFNLPPTLYSSPSPTGSPSLFPSQNPLSLLYLYLSLILYVPFPITLFLVTDAARIVCYRGLPLRSAESIYGLLTATSISQRKDKIFVLH